MHLFIVNPLHNSDRTVLDFRLPCYHFLFRTQPQPATEERMKHLLKGAGVASAREEVEVIKTFIIIIQLYRLSPDFISNYRS